MPPLTLGSSRSIHLLLGPRKRPSSHAVEAYRDSGEARCAKSPHAVACPFKFLTIYINKVMRYMDIVISRGLHICYDARGVQQALQNAGATKHTCGFGFRMWPHVTGCTTAPQQVSSHASFTSHTSHITAHDGTSACNSNPSPLAAREPSGSGRRQIRGDAGQIARPARHTKLTTHVRSLSPLPLWQLAGKRLRASFHERRATQRSARHRDAGGHRRRRALREASPLTKQRRPVGARHERRSVGARHVTG